MKIQMTRRRRKIQKRRKTGDQCILSLQEGLRSCQVCLKTRRTVGHQCRWMRLLGESQKKLLENWRKMRRSRMKRKTHQRRNLKERRPGLEKWKRYSDLHYMMVWVVHMKVLEDHTKVLEVHKKVLEVHMMVSEVHTKVLEVHTKALEVCRMASDACKIALVLKA